MMSQPVGMRNILQDRQLDTHPHWGFFWNEVGYAAHMGPDFDAMCLAECGDIELQAIERILKRALAHRLTWG